jgi:hypothetical protein
MKPAMEKGRRKFIVIAVAAAFMLAAWSAPSHQARIEILTHDRQDGNPHQMQAAIKVGMIGFSFLYTWTSKLGR